MFPVIIGLLDFKIGRVYGMRRFFTPGETAPISGTYVEVGHGGGKVKNPQTIEIQQGETLPDLKKYTVTIVHKGEEKVRDRQHKWMFLSK